jgi:hypothetical protein
MPAALIPLHAIKGRGAATRLAHRFSSDERNDFDDGWGTLEEGAAEADELQPLATEVRFEDVKSVLSDNDSPDIPSTARSIRTAAANTAASTATRGPRTATSTCRRASTSRPRSSPSATSSRCCAPSSAQELPAQPHRHRHRHRLLPAHRARAAAHALGHRAAAGNRHPFALVTKSSAVERDLDLIAPMAADRLAAVYVTVTTLDATSPASWSRAPPRRTGGCAPSARWPSRRARGREPGAADSLRHRRHGAGARSRLGGRRAQRLLHVVRLPWEVAPLFKEWLSLHYPQRADRIMARIQEMRGGKDYDADFATRMKGSGVWADLIGQRFRRRPAASASTASALRWTSARSARRGRRGKAACSTGSLPRPPSPEGGSRTPCRRPRTSRRPVPSPGTPRSAAAAPAVARPAAPPSAATAAR